MPWPVYYAFLKKGIRTSHFEYMISPKTIPLSNEQKKKEYARTHTARTLAIYIPIVHSICVVIYSNLRGLCCNGLYGIVDPRFCADREDPAMLLPYTTDPIRVLSDMMRSSGWIDIQEAIFWIHMSLDPRTEIVRRWIMATSDGVLSTTHDVICWRRFATAIYTEHGELC